MTIAASKLVKPGRVAVITINWNGWENTLACLDALHTSQGADWHLYIVDNGSTDDSLTNLRGLGERVTVIATGVNGGWTGGNNVGIERALASDAEFIFLLNNDAFVEPDTIATLISTFRSQAGPHAPVLGPIHRGLNSSAYDFHTAEADPRTGIPGWKPLSTGTEPPALMETAYIGGAAMLAHRQHFEAVGLLDDRFYLNFDDTDWCMRVRSAGFPLLMVGSAVIRHIGSVSIGGRSSPLQMYFMSRNRLLFAEKHCTWSERLWLCKWYVVQARRLAKDGGSPRWITRLFAKTGVIAAFRQGVADYLFRRFGDCPSKVRSWNYELRH